MNSSFISSAGMSPPLLSNGKELFIKPTYKIKNNLKYIDAYW
jgi:hypothetical protein